MLPQGCAHIIVPLDEYKGELIDTSDSTKSVEFDYQTISDKDANKVVQIMAPVFTEDLSLEGSLTKNLSFFELFNILAVEDINLLDNWSSSQVFKSMATPIGVSNTGTVYLDLHDKAHGPHGLVAGTTGSGKSELLQTYILAMSIMYHP